MSTRFEAVSITISLYLLKKIPCKFTKKTTDFLNFNSFSIQDSSISLILCSSVVDFFLNCGLQNYHKMSRIKFTYFFLFALVLLILSSSSFKSQSKKENFQKYPLSDYNVYAVPLPKKLDFSGELMPLSFPVIMNVLSFNFPFLFSSKTSLIFKIDPS